MFRFALALVLVLALDHCECLIHPEEQQQTTELWAIGSDLSESDDILEDMLDYIIEDDNIVEGRKKKKKKKFLKYLTMAMLFKAVFFPKLLALVKFFVAKAYLFSMMALVIAATVSTGSKSKGSKDTEQVVVINLIPKNRSYQGQSRAYRYWRRQEPQLHEEH